MLFDPVPLKVLDNVSTGTSAEFDLGAIDRVTLAVDFKTGVTAGVLVLEVAPFGGYTGTWATVLTVTFAGTAPNIGRTQGEICARVGRVRITTNLTGGNCDAYVERSLVGKGNT